MHILWVYIDQTQRLGAEIDRIKTDSAILIAKNTELFQQMLSLADQLSETLDQSHLFGK